MMLDINHIKKELSAIPDPEIPVITIEELGVLRAIKYESEKLIITITPTYSGCPAMDRFQQDIKEVLAKLNISKYQINTQYDPPWTTDCIGEKAKEKLKKYGIAPPMHKSTDKNVLSGNMKEVPCPKCESEHTELISQFSSTACKALYRCTTCLEPFEYFKCL